MIATISLKGKTFRVDFSSPIDISIPMSEKSARAWYAEPMRFEPVRNGDWIGEVKQGGSVNFRNIFFNPHAHGTHTECVGHIAKEIYNVNEHLKNYFFLAELITVLPDQTPEGDFIIRRKQLEMLLEAKDVQAVVLRTVANSDAKLSMNWSNTDPPYLEESAAKFLAEKKIDHLLIDLPSVDKEVDGGKLLAHHAFWEYPHNTQFQRTITEFIYVPNTVYDGTYLLNLQTAPFVNDATPSRPVLFRVLAN
ncbi:MAG TPA: cyclase family protein [Bacteroidia bacterium]|jgi:kynurenine formamidase|nr:cyclase family protein [Bacteroidia bacterium]